MREIIIGWVYKYLYGPNTQNAKTLEAIKQIERGENLVKNDNIEDLFKKLKI